MMDLNLKGKTAVVCGSTQGMGLAIAQQLAQQGAAVVMVARNQEKLTEVVKTLSTEDQQNHHTLVADFSDPAQVKSAIEAHLAKHPEANILINNTGGPPPGLAKDADPAAFQLAFNQHLICNQVLAQALGPAMQQAKYGRIINVISTSVKQPLPNLGVSNTIRGAVANWAKTLANELGQYNITVNNVLPGATETGRLSSIFENKAKKTGLTVDQVIENEKAIIPMRRFGTPQEFANVVGFLSSPAGAYINGVNIPVDGGRTACL
ncbi:SDR family oxidoreductase [Marinicella sp. S1101]|uniref:SDR family oxidoreductase n=1 Tax=Marinicella marina TaxID=2996016 RepID=UPI00226102EC|nr:SDR family oxidoreductase [Marinicella marina]MCX7554313.1 SDR family oxidoreductase [Marinicella marina]MDJ1138696.1 SDR family oxidoreductase [Marinicella marina]